MKISNRWIVAGLVVLLGALGAIGFSQSSSWMETKIELIKPEDVPEDMFRPIADTLTAQLAPFEQQKIWQVPLSKVEEVVHNEERVKDARVMRSWPREIQIKVWPYQPIMLVLDEKGQVYPVTKDARLLNPMPVRETRSMPIARGTQFLLQRELRQSAAHLVDAFEKEENLNSQEISEITFNQKEGFRVYLTKSGTEIRLGDSDFDLKLKRVGKVISYLDGQYIKGRVIDARYSKKVLVRVRNAP